MEILVCVKQVLDARVPIEVTENGGLLQKEASPLYVLNPSDRCALEQAIKLRHAFAPCHVTAITVGPEGARTVLEQCLARGVDAVVHLLTDDSTPLDSFVVAQGLSDAIKAHGFDLIICGDRSLDEGSSEVSSILAELLNIPQATGVVKLSVSQDSQVVAERRLERGYRQVVQTALPALVAVDASICEPRYLTRRAIRSAAAMLPEKCKVIHVSGEGGGQAELGRRKVQASTPPRPRAKRIVTADEGKSAQDRIAMMLGGGFSPVKAAKPTNGGSQGPADEIIAFLKEKGLLS